MDELLKSIDVVFVGRVHKPLPLEFHLLVDSIKEVILVARIVELEVVGQFPVCRAVERRPLLRTESLLLELA